MSSLQKRAEAAADPEKLAASPAGLTHPEIRFVFYGLMLGGFLQALNQTIVASALPTIGRDLNDFHNLSWVVIAYLLSSTIVAPLYGKLADIHGRRGMMMTALGLFVAGSVLCAVAPDMATLVAGRTLQGIGGGGIVPMVQITVADMVTPRERGRYQAYMGTAWISAGVIGPALGGIIAQNWHWSLIFWLNVPLGLLTAALLSRSMKKLPPAGRKHKLDFLGVALVMAAAMLFLLALTTGGVHVPWLSPTIFSLIGGSIVLTVVVGWWLKRAPEPFLPLNVLANPVMKLGTAATSFAMGVMTGFMIYMPLYFQTVHKLTPTQAGLCLIPVIVMTTPGSMASGRAMMHLNRYKLSPYIGMVLATLAVAALVVWPAMPVLWAVIATAIVGYGVGTVFPTATVCVQNAVWRHEVGIATGAMNFFRALTSALAVAIMGAILLSGLGFAPERGGAGVEVLAANAGASGLDVAGVFQWVFVAALVFSVIALVAVVLMEERPLHGAKEMPPTEPAE
ncbi:MAG: MFS transporter [Xanthobacteraceae bacterium]|nr:MFS transporter [Xanthobacteraceae bacterium]